MIMLIWKTYEKIQKRQEVRKVFNHAFAKIRRRFSGFYEDRLEENIV